MTTIAAGASSTVTLQQGKHLIVAGTGIAVLGPGPQSSMQIGLQGQSSTVGPFDYDQIIYLTAITQLDYSVYVDPVAYNPATLTGAVHVWAFLGDSITNGSSASNFAYSYVNLATQYAGPFVARLDSIEAGTPGYKASQALAFLPTALAQSTAPTALCVMIGINDSATTNFSDYQDSVASIIALAKAKYLPVVLCTITPHSSTWTSSGSVSTSDARKFIKQANAWLRIWGGLQNCVIAETYGALADPTTGDLLASYDSGDGTHPNNAGHQKMAQVVAAAMVAAVKPSAKGLIFAADPFSLIANPLMVGAGTMATSWFEQPGGTGTAPTYSIAADTTGLLPAGRWQQMDFDATASGGNRIFAFSPSFSGVSVGDTVAYTGRAHIEDISGTWEADVVAGTAGFSPALLNGSAASIGTTADHAAGRNLGNIAGTGNNVYEYHYIVPVVIPAGTTGLLQWNKITLPTGKRVKARFGVMDVINLTALGLTSVIGSGSMVNLSGP